MTSFRPKSADRRWLRTIGSGSEQHEREATLRQLRSARVNAVTSEPRTVGTWILSRQWIGDAELLIARVVPSVLEINAQHMRELYALLRANGCKEPERCRVSGESPTALRLYFANRLGEPLPASERASWRELLQGIEAAERRA